MEEKTGLNILGARIDNLSRFEILEKINNFLDEPCFHQIVTVNPEFILEAQKNHKFREILNQCELNVADGVGIWFAFLRYGKYLKVRITGVDLMMEILRIANEKGLSIFLAAKKGGLSTWEETRDAIHKIYPGLEIEGGNINYRFSVPTLDSRLLGNDKWVVFCNFGAPNQEFFINSQKSDKIRLAMGVGGGFDFLAGRVRRAPLFLRRIGLEWFWRLILQPRRLKRIFRAVMVFPIKIVFNKSI